MFCVLLLEQNTEIVSTVIVFVLLDFNIISKEKLIHFS